MQIEMIEALEAMSVHTAMGGQLENFDANTEFIGGKRKKGRLKGALKKATEKVKKAAKKMGAAAAFAPLLPFKGAMKKALKRRGVAAPNKMDELAKVFYTNVLQSKKYEGEFQHVEPVTVSLIVSAVLSFFKDMMKKKAEGTASPEELALAKDADESAEAFTKSAGAGDDDDDEGGEGAGDEGGSMKGVIVMVAVALALYVVLK